jgi:L-threonylcarbamoyladenylate synthase
MPRPAAPSEIERAARLLRDGRLVAFPTETVYGLGANALDAEAVARIYAAKHRPSNSPLIVHVASIEMAQSLAATWPDVADRLARRFWPGPLTLVVEKKSAIPDIVTAGLPTVGLRMPAHPVALALIRAAGVPIAAPSANRFTELSPTTAEHVRLSLGAEVDLILDGGPCEVGIESTVLSLTGTMIGSQPVLLRPGGISRAEIESLIGPVATATEISDDLESAPHPSPGMHLRHYSPRTNLYLTTSGELPDQGRGIYLEHRNPSRQKNLTSRQMPDRATDYAAQLYEVLHQADAGNYDWIAVDLPPQTPEWEAIHDRLKRAATKR